MLPALAPILFPTGLPRNGLIAWHDLYFPNLFLNSGTLSGAGTSGGAGSAPVITAGQADPWGGTSAVRVQLNAGGTAAGDISGIYSSIGWNYAAAGATIGAWMKSNTGSNQTIQMVVYNVALKTLTSDWQFFSATETAASGTIAYIARCRPAAGGDQTADILIAAPQLYPAATLPGYVTTTTLQSITDLSGRGNTLTRGSNASAADTNDPTVLGPGLSAVTDDGANTVAIGIDKSGAFTVVWAGKPTGTSGTLFSLTDSATASTKFQRVVYSGAGKIKAGSAAGGAESLSDELTVDATAYQVLALTSDGTTLTLKRMDTGTSVTVADTNPDGNARFALFSTAGSTLCANPCDAAIALGDLPYNRALSSAELTRAYRYLKSQWAARGVTIL